MIRARIPLVSGAGALLLLTACSQSGGDGGPDPSVLTIARRDLQITVQENAELQALRETVVRSQVEGQATIIFLIEEGRVVQQGEKLVELDASELVDKRANQAITVAKAEAGLAQARKGLEILQKELTAKSNTASSDLRIAEMELEKFLGRAPDGSVTQTRNSDMVKKLKELVEGPAPVADPSAPPHSGPAPAPAPAPVNPDALVTQVDPQRYAQLVDKVGELLTDAGGAKALDRDMGEMANMVLQQVDKIRLAMADLKYQEAYYGHSRRLAQRKFITPNELEKDQIEYQRRLSQVGLAWNDLDLLVNYELYKQRIKLMQDVENARLELERVVASNDAEVTRADSELRSKQAEYDLAKDRLDNLEKQIRNAAVHAPTPGLVIYARQERDRRQSETIREGISVRERQDLIVLPDTTRMQAVVKVQEARVAQVHIGQRAHISVESLPDRVFTGRVTRVAQQADSSSGYMSTERKVYTTVVELDGDNTEGVLRSRMAAAVTILVDHLHDVLAVPLQAVRRDRSVNYVWKSGPDGSEPVPVEVGQHNAEYVVVTQGLAEGDVIHLTPPAGAQQPNLPQPAVPMPELPTAPAAEPARDDGTADLRTGDARNGDGTNGEDRGEDGERRGGRRGRNGGQGTPQMTEEQRAQFAEFRTLGDSVRTFLLQKYPERKAEIENRRTMSTVLEDAAVVAALEKGLGETWTRYDAIRQQMRTMGNRGGRGETPAPAPAGNQDR